MPVLGELELGWRLLAATSSSRSPGSNGKTTTVELIGHIHREAGLPVAVAGNVGTALTSLPGTLDAGADGRRARRRRSSSRTPRRFAPEAAVLLNLAEDHLDRHGTFDAYRAAKLRAFARQADEARRRRARRPRRRGPRRRARGASASAPARARRSRDRAGQLWWDERAAAGAPARSACAARTTVENAMAAAAVCLARGVDADAVRAGLRDASPASRTGSRRSRRVDGVLYVNDSKATNVASALVAIDSFAGAASTLILGGRGKGGDFTPLATPVAERCRAAYLIGETAAELARRAGAAPASPLHDCGDLEPPCAAARAAARPGDVVLLSPACACYDQYRDFEAARRPLPRARRCAERADQRPVASKRRRRWPGPRGRAASRSRSSTGCC